MFKYGFPMTFGYFSLSKRQQLYGYLSDIKEVLNFPLIPTMTNNSKDKWQNNKNQCGIYFEPVLNGRFMAYEIG